MFYFDCKTIAAHHAFENDWDVPTGLLGNTVVSESDIWRVSIVAA